MAQKGLHLTIEWVIENVNLNSKILFHSNQAFPSWKTNYNTNLRTTKVSNILSLIQAKWVEAMCQHLTKGKKLTQLKAKKTWWTKFSHRDIRIQLSTQKLISQVLLWYQLIWDTKIKLIQPITSTLSIVILRNRVHLNFLPTGQRVVHQSSLMNLQPSSKIKVAITLSWSKDLIRLSIRIKEEHSTLSLILQLKHSLITHMLRNTIWMDLVSHRSRSPSHSHCNSLDFRLSNRHHLLKEQAKWYSLRGMSLLSRWASSLRFQVDLQITTSNQVG